MPRKGPILIIEDDHDDQELLQEVFDEFNIPIMSGLELKQKINETEELLRKHIPFIFLTTNPDALVVTQAFQLNVQGYFVKPSTLTDIRMMMRTILDYWSLN